jgi:hypothetical protein
VVFQNENDDLFAGFTQEFDVSCLTIEKLHGQNSGDSLEKLPIGDFNKRSSNQDVNKILCDTDSVSGKDHEEDNNMEGFHDEFADYKDGKTSQTCFFFSITSFLYFSLQPFSNGMSELLL